MLRPEMGGLNLTELAILPLVFVWLIGVPIWFYEWAKRLAISRGRRPNGWAGWSAVGALPFWLSLPGVVLIAVLATLPKEEKVPSAGFSTGRRRS